MTSVQSFFDARDVAAPAPAPDLDLAAFGVDDEDDGGAGAGDATLARARDDALAWNAALGREWRDAVRPAYEAVEREAVAGLALDRWLSWRRDLRVTLLERKAYVVEGSNSESSTGFLSNYPIHLVDFYLTQI